MMASDKNCTFPPDTPGRSAEALLPQRGRAEPRRLGQGSDRVRLQHLHLLAHDAGAVAHASSSTRSCMRYYGNRAPLTYGAHPIEYTDAVRQLHAGGAGEQLRLPRRAQVQQVPGAAAGDEGLPGVDQERPGLQQGHLLPVGAPAGRVHEASVRQDRRQGRPRRGGVARRERALHAAHLGRGRRDHQGVDGNKADIVFNVKSVDDDRSSVEAGIKPGSLTGVSHIDIKYSTDVPFRIRLLTNDGPLSARPCCSPAPAAIASARIRIKDFFPGPEASASEVGRRQARRRRRTWPRCPGIAFESAADGGERREGVQHPHRADHAARRQLQRLCTK